MKEQTQKIRKGGISILEYLASRLSKVIENSISIIAERRMISRSINYEFSTRRYAGGINCCAWYRNSEKSGGRVS